MMMLSKLKSIGLTAVVTIALTAGLGFGLTPAQAEDEPPHATQPNNGPRPATSPKPAEPLDDVAFLRRLCLELTNVFPSPIELGYFTRDPDANKRAKVVEWMVTDDVLKTYLAKKLGVPVEQIQVLRGTEANSGQGYKAVVYRPTKGAARTASVLAVALSPDTKNLATIRDPVATYKSLVFSPNGTTLAAQTPNSLTYLSTAKYTQPHSLATINSAVTGSVVVNERYADVTNMTQGNDHSLWLSLLNAQPELLSVDQNFLLGSYFVDPPATATEFFAQTTAVADSDVDFLRRVIQSVRGSAPTALEEKYFTADSDPKKREKLLDLLLKDPAVAKKLGDDWKKKMLAPPQATTTVLPYAPYTYSWPESNQHLYFYQGLQATPWNHYQPYNHLNNYVPLVESLHLPADRFDKLVSELIAAKKTEEQTLEAITLATVGRLPTAEEKRVALALIGAAQDRKTAWVGLARAYATSEEGKKHVAPPAKEPVPPKK